MKTMLKFWMLFMATIAVASAQTDETEQTQVQPAFCQEHGGCWDIVITQGPLADTIRAGVNMTLYPEMQNDRGRKITTHDIHFMWGTWYICKDAEPNQARMDEFTNFEMSWLLSWRANKAARTIMAHAAPPAAAAPQIQPKPAVVAQVKPAKRTTKPQAPVITGTIFVPMYPTAPHVVKDPLAGCAHPGTGTRYQPICLDEKIKISAIIAKQKPVSNKKGSSGTGPRSPIIWLSLMCGFGLIAAAICLTNARLNAKPGKHHTVWQWLTHTGRSLGQRAEAKYLKWAIEKKSLAAQQAIAIEIAVDASKPHNFDDLDFPIFKKLLGKRLQVAVTTGYYKIENDGFSRRTSGKNCPPLVTVSCEKIDSDAVWDALNRFRQQSSPAIALCRSSQIYVDGVTVQQFCLGCVHNIAPGEISHEQIPAMAAAN